MANLVQIFFFLAGGSSTSTELEWYHLDQLAVSCCIQFRPPLKGLTRVVSLVVGVPRWPFPSGSLMGGWVVEKKRCNLHVISLSCEDPVAWIMAFKWIETATLTMLVGQACDVRWYSDVMSLFLDRLWSKQDGTRISVGVAMRRIFSFKGVFPIIILVDYLLCRHVCSNRCFWWLFCWSTVRDGPIDFCWLRKYKLFAKWLNLALQKCFFPG